jgi:hypothetical protein
MKVHSKRKSFRISGGLYLRIQFGDVFCLRLQIKSRVKESSNILNLFKGEWVDIFFSILI